MANGPQPQSKPKLTAEIIKQQFRMMASWTELAAAFAHELDCLGDANQHPEGSDKRELAKVRDEVDFAFAKFLQKASTQQRVRAETTRCLDLLVDAAVKQQGDGHDALHLTRRYHALFGDETEPDGEPPPETFPDSFAWDTYLRVSALAELVKQFPKHLRHSARQMHGWPMIVSHHLDCLPEFRRIAERLDIGAHYPLNVAQRKKRGTETPLLRYLEPLVWRLHVLRLILTESAESRSAEDFDRRIYGLWWEFPDPPPSREIVAVLRRVAALSPLTQTSAREWSRKVIAPLIMIDDACTPESCTIPALRNIWQHRSVKSRATYQSRLHSAVTDTLQRFGRPG